MPFDANPSRQNVGTAHAEFDTPTGRNTRCTVVPDTVYSSQQSDEAADVDGPSSLISATLAPTVAATASTAPASHEPRRGRPTPQPPDGNVSSYVVWSESEPATRLTAANTERSSSTPALVAEKMPCSVTAIVPPVSGDRVATVR